MAIVSSSTSKVLGLDIVGNRLDNKCIVDLIGVFSSRFVNLTSLDLDFSVSNDISHDGDTTDNADDIHQYYQLYLNWIYQITPFNSPTKVTWG